MNIPPKYEDVVAKLDAALARESEQRELHQIATETLGQFADENQKLHADLAALREELSGANEQLRMKSLWIAKLIPERDDLQQRLTVAEQRNALAINLLESIERCGIHCVTLGGPSIVEKVRAFIEGREPAYAEPGTKASGLTRIDNLVIDNRGLRLDISEMKCITMTNSALNKLGGKK